MAYAPDSTRAIGRTRGGLAGWFDDLSQYIQQGAQDVKSVVSTVSSVTGGGGSGGAQSAAIDSAYQQAIRGQAPAAFLLLKSIANASTSSAADKIKAQLAVQDLLDRGWYGGLRSGPYLSDTVSDTVNHGAAQASPGGSILSASLLGGLSLPTLALIGGVGYLAFRTLRRRR